MIKVLVIIDDSSEFSRRLLRGLIKYSNDNESWIFFQLPSYYKSLNGTNGIVDWAKEWKADAVIARWDHEESLLAQLNVPIIFQNYKKRSECFSNLTGDYIGTGVMAAHFFMERNYQNFAFYGNINAVWSKERGEGFRKEVEKFEGKYYHFETENLRGEPWGKRHIELERWVCSLPKPIALFACDDTFALQISEVCKLNNISIPNEIALLGVDNDELICNLSDPPISSIVLDVERGGYELGRLIHQLVKKEKLGPGNVTIKPMRIELRNSTEKYNIENKHILTVVDYIVANFTSDISIDFLTELVPLSRRNLEVKFKNEMGTSIYQFILQNRIEYFSKLLLNTDRSLFELALESGFNDCKNISRIFKKFKGHTPVEFRQRLQELSAVNA